MYPSGRPHPSALLPPLPKKEAGSRDWSRLVTRNGSTNRVHDIRVDGLSSVRPFVRVTARVPTYAVVISEAATVPVAAPSSRIRNLCAH
jgi:hypothetical protein